MTENRPLTAEEKAENDAAIQKTRTFLNALCEFLGNSEGMTTEEIMTDLREEGYDPDAMIARIQEKIKEWKKGGR